MKTIVPILLIAFALACASVQPVIPPDERVALVMNRSWTRGEGIDGIALNQIPALIHASVVVNRLSEIDERSYDTVVVLSSGRASSIRDHSYDANEDAVVVTSQIPFAYDVRRGGSIVHSGAITLVVPYSFDPRRGLGRSYLQGVNALLRDVADVR